MKTIFIFLKKYDFYAAILCITVFCTGCQTNTSQDSTVGKHHLLIVVDVQNDFVTGALSTAEALDAVPHINLKLKQYADQGSPILFTMDSHDPRLYPTRQEGKFLPIFHCISGSHGEALADELDLKRIRYSLIKKSEFASLALVDKVKKLNPDTIEIVGIYTDICVITNALLLKTALPEVPIIIDASCCAGSTPKKHIQALSVMESCQITVKGTDRE